MKNWKSPLIIVGTMLLVAVFGYSATTVYAKQENPLKIWFHNENGAYETLCLVDEETGVNYVVVATNTGNGNRSISITPRLKPDRTLYVRK